MARARNIKPGFFKNEDLAECSLAARLCFAGLWTLADREGRLEDRPKRIKGELFPFDSFEVEPLLCELAARGFILRYEVDGARCIQVSRFSEHQTPHYTEKASVIKPPALQESAAHDAAPTPGGLQEDSRSDEAIKRGSKPPDSLIPDSLIPPNPRRRGHGVQEFPPGFEALWSLFPRKVAKDAAAKAFARLRPDDSLQARIVAALRRQSTSVDWTKDSGRFVPHLATWLNGRRWEDEAGAEAPDVFAGAR